MLALWLESEVTTLSCVLFQLENTFTLTTQWHSDAHRSFSSRPIFSSSPHHAQLFSPLAVLIQNPTGKLFGLALLQTCHDNSHQSGLCQRAMPGKTKNICMCAQSNVGQSDKKVFACQVVHFRHLCVLQMHLIFKHCFLYSLFL